MTPGSAPPLDRFRTRMQALPSRDRRALALGALVLVPVLLWAGAVRPYLGSVAELRDRADASHALLERERQVLQQAPDLPDRLDATRVTLERWEARLVRSGNLALAEAEVTSLLQRLARENRVHLEEVRSVVPPPGHTPPPGLVPVRLSLQGESDLQGVLELIHALEDDPLLLRIESVSMTPRDEALSVVLVVEAFAPPPPEPAP